MALLIRLVPVPMRNSIRHKIYGAVPEVHIDLNLGVTKRTNY